MAPPRGKAKEHNWNQQINDFKIQYRKLIANKDFLRVEKQVLEFVNLYKPAVETYLSVFQTEAQIANACAFVIFCKFKGFSHTGVNTILRHFTGLATEGCRAYVDAVGSRLLGISKLMDELDAASKALIVVGLTIQIYIYSRQGAYGAAYGELVKTIFALGCAPAAVLDLVFTILEMLCPKIVNHPFYRILKAFNPLSNVAQLADTVFTLALIFGGSMENNRREYEKQLTDLATRWEKGTLGFVTIGSRKFAVWLDEIYGFNWAWVKNLVDYHNSHRNQTSYLHLYPGRQVYT